MQHKARGLPRAFSIINTMKIKLLSWNIRQGGGTRRKEICATLKSHRPDIVTLQEFRRNAAGDEIREHLSKMGLSHQYAADTKAGKDNTIFIASRLPFQAGNFMGEERHTI